VTSDDKLYSCGLWLTGAPTRVPLPSERGSNAKVSILSSRNHAVRTWRTVHRFQQTQQCHLLGYINNSVLLTSLSLTRSNESSAEPRVAVSNNDCTVKFFDVNVQDAKGVDGPPKRISKAGTLRLDVPMNHCMSSLLLIPTRNRGPGSTADVVLST
jgi:hypothetical protein